MLRCCLAEDLEIGMMNNNCFEILDADLEAINMLKDFVPSKVFDAHSHLYVASTIPQFANKNGIYNQDFTTPEDYEKHMRPFLPNADTIRLNLIPMPDPAMERNRELRERANGHIFDQLKNYPKHVGSPYVLMDDTEQDIGDLISSEGVAGLKCYCYAAKTGHYNDCTVGDFLPEAAWAVSNQTGIPIILHLMKPKALADPDNLSYIQTMAKRYPDAKIILAHCARGFAAWTVIDTIKSIAKMDNVWFDVSAICESAPMASCIMQTAGKRVMWGSDYPICMHRGRVISLNTGFTWLTNEAIAELREHGLPACSVAAENLLAFRQACILLSLDATQIEDIFYNNAMRLFERGIRQ